jgi:hypothetical protein
MRHRWVGTAHQTCSRCGLQRKKVQHYDSGDANRMRHSYNVWLYWMGAGWRWLRARSGVPGCSGLQEASS